ncbi:MAG: hypothetical protein OEQ13_03735 [Acidobacteriota bacterium]|nr:hypothetical protein [Acidobacteriota bacterium]
MTVHSRVAGRVALTMILLALVSVGSASAQEIGFFGWGPRVGISADPDQLFGGVHFELGDFAENVLFRPNVEVGFGDDETVLAVNAAVHWLIPRRLQRWRPYVGGEVGLNHREIDRGGRFKDIDDTDIAINVVGGFETERGGGSRMLLEGKVGLAERPRIKLLVGWTF